MRCFKTENPCCKFIIKIIKINQDATCFTSALTIEILKNSRILNSKPAPSSILNKVCWCRGTVRLWFSPNKMSSKDSKGEVAVDKVTENNGKAPADGITEIKGTKRPAEVSLVLASQHSCMASIEIIRGWSQRTCFWIPVDVFHARSGRSSPYWPLLVIWCLLQLHLPAMCTGISFPASWRGNCVLLWSSTFRTGLTESVGFWQGFVYFSGSWVIS